MALKLHNRIHAEKLLSFLNSSRVSRFNKPRYQCKRFIQTNARALSNWPTLCNDDNSAAFRTASKVFSRGDLRCDRFTRSSGGLATRPYSSQSAQDDGENKPIAQEDEVNPDAPSEIDFPVTHSLPAAVVVPEHWPNVPLIAVSRNPVFPRFIKLLEVRFCNLVITDVKNNRNCFV